MFARALKSGVTIANGSDVGVFAHGENARELELMVAYGMSPKEALRAATATAAAVLRKDKELGRIAPGYLADLVAVKGDPLADISVIEKPAVVVKDGRVAVAPARADFFGGAIPGWYSTGRPAFSFASCTILRTSASSFLRVVDDPVLDRVLDAADPLDLVLLVRA